MKKKVALMGAGFSGLTAAWALQKLNVHVEVFEKTSSAGGLIRPQTTEDIVESAAHAILNSADVEELFSDLGLKMLKALPTSHRRWIFRGHPQKWPLTLIETLQSLGWPKKPLSEESVEQWVHRHFSAKMNDFVVSAALQGIYGSSTTDLSASLVLKNMFEKESRAPKGKFRGSVAPEKGMFQLLEKLSTQVRVHYNSQKNVEDLLKDFDSVVVAASITSVSDMIASQNTELANQLKKIPTVSLTSVTLNYESLHPDNKLRGFGCLFPRSEIFNSLGVLFNSDIFAGRGEYSETWIFADSFKAVKDDQILSKIAEDRKRIRPHADSVVRHSVYKWPQVLPVYGLQLERLLKSDLWKGDPFISGARISDRVYLSGNYLGGIGLSKILTYNKRLALKIVNEINKET